MTELPFTKLHGDENDFILSWADQSPQSNWPEISRRICARTTGIGADGWMLVWRETGGLRTRLFNSDGSEAEISGNGTRCAAAFALQNGAAAAPTVIITTAAGPKSLRLISQDEHRFLFEMDMGAPRTEELRTTLHLAGRDWDATILNVGNPQCAIFVKTLPDDWRIPAAEAEAHPRFPNARMFLGQSARSVTPSKLSSTNAVRAKRAAPARALRVPPLPPSFAARSKLPSKSERPPATSVFVGTTAYTSPAPLN